MIMARPGVKLMWFLAGVAVGSTLALALVVAVYARTLIVNWQAAQLREAAQAELAPELVNYDVAPLIRANTEADVHRLRAELIDAIWPTGGFPHHRLPDEVIEDAISPLAAEATNLAGVQVLVTVMEYGVDSRAYRFEADRSEDCLVIYHHGHEERYSSVSGVIVRFIDEGCDVIALNMPLTGGNSQPVVNGPRGLVELTSHDRLMLLESDDFSPLSYFLEPVAASLNHALSVRNVERVAMVGLSGGGWTTTVYAALDPRITFSAPVAGSLPLFLRAWAPYDSWGDYEQMHPTFVHIAGYLDLYVMGAAGREQVQILNRPDPCCFSGVRHEVYEEAVAAAARGMGGTFSVFLDENPSHSISEDALERILAGLAK